MLFYLIEMMDMTMKFNPNGKNHEFSIQFGVKKDAVE